MEKYLSKTSKLHLIRCEETVLKIITTARKDLGLALTFLHDEGIYQIIDAKSQRQIDIDKLTKDFKDGDKCGFCEERKADVKFLNCPYALEVDECYMYYNFCDECYTQACYDI